MRKLPGFVLLFIVCGTFVTGCVGGGIIGIAHTPPDRTSAIYAPLPHSVPPSADAVPFRFAMVHDVIHERYARHGDAFYEERERRARENLAVLHPDSETAYALTDDIAVGLARRGRYDEAIALVRGKLKRQKAIGLKGKDLYTSYANLGEFLVQANVWNMMGGDVEARERVKQGCDFFRQSMKVNPNAHFGREEWQLVAVESLLNASIRPALVKKVDLVGNRLDRVVPIHADAISDTYFQSGEEDVGRPYLPRFATNVHFQYRPIPPLGADEDSTIRTGIRGLITPVGGEDSFGSWLALSGKRAPFDEPAMWLIGEWRQGAGPNPHFALCLGEIMLRVGQRYLAWTCFERASRMAEQFWPTEEMQQFLRKHCKERQTAIEKSLPAREVAELRPKFEAELAFGEAYQRDYQAYTESKIQSGANINDPQFFEEFHASREPIASKVGSEEWYAGTNHSGQLTAKFRAFWEWGPLSGGASVLALGLILTWFSRKNAAQS